MTRLFLIPKIHLSIESAFEISFLSRRKHENSHLSCFGVFSPFTASHWWHFTFVTCEYYMFYCALYMAMSLHECIRGWGWVHRLSQDEILCLNFELAVIIIGNNKLLNLELISSQFTFFLLQKKILRKYSQILF